MTVVQDDICTQIITFTAPSGDQFQNKFTWQYNGSDITDANFIAGMDDWAEDFYEILDTWLTSAVSSFTSEYNKIVWNATKELWEISYNIGIGAGTVTFTDITDLLPFQSCPTLIGYTERPKSRGRKSPPLMCEDSQSSSLWAAAVSTDLVSLLFAYLNDHILATGQSVDPGIASTVTGAFLSFIAGEVKNVVFTQRRRTRGRGS